MAEHSITILLVDDDAGHRELVQRNLRRAGIQNPVDTVTNGSDALDYVFCRGAYSHRTGNSELVIFLDLNMPGSFDGVEVLRQIKANSQAKLIPVIILTTTAEPKEINRCYELGCSVYVTKPGEPSAFFEAIRRLGLVLEVVSMPTDPARLR
jgi:CheY-like chemotaxis protein